MTLNQVVLSIIIPVVVALGGYIIGAVANRRLVKADASDKVSSSYSKLVDDLQDENSKLRTAIQKLEENYEVLKLRQDNYGSLHNKKLDELGSKYEKLIEENVTLRSQYAELKREYAGHRERSKQRLDSLKLSTDVKTEAMEAKIREYKQIISLQEERIRILEVSIDGGLKT